MMLRAYGILSVCFKGEREREEEKKRETQGLENERGQGVKGIGVH